jgi:hypothetical protein
MSYSAHGTSKTSIAGWPGAPEPKDSPCDFDFRPATAKCTALRVAARTNDIELLQTGRHVLQLSAEIQSTPTPRKESPEFGLRQIDSTSDEQGRPTPARGPGRIEHRRCRARAVGRAAASDGAYYNRANLGRTRGIDGKPSAQATTSCKGPQSTARGFGWTDSGLSRPIAARWGRESGQFLFRRMGWDFHFAIGVPAQRGLESVSLPRPAVSLLRIPGQLSEERWAQRKRNRVSLVSDVADLCRLQGSRTVLSKNRTFSRT